MSSHELASVVHDAMRFNVWIGIECIWHRFVTFINEIISADDMTCCDVNNISEYVCVTFTL